MTIKKTIFSILISFLLGTLLSAQEWPFKNIPQDETAVLDEVRELLGQGKYEEAERRFKYFDEKPDSVYKKQSESFLAQETKAKSKLRRGIKYFEERQYAKSQEIFSAFVKKNPGNAVELKYYLLNLSMLNPSKAVEETNRLLYYIPFSAQFVFIRGNAYESLGEFEKALADYSLAIRITPDFKLYRERAILNYRLGNMEAALSDITESIRLNPDGVNESYLDRSSLYHAMGENEKCEEDCRHYIKNGGKNPLALKNLAMVSIEKNLYDEALDYSNQFIKAAPQSPESYYTRAGVYFYRGEYEKSIKDSDEALKKDPGFVLAYECKVGSLLKLEKTGEALREAQSAVSRAEKGNDLLYLYTAHEVRGEAYLALNKKDDARADFELALNLAGTEVYRQKIQDFIEQTKK